MLWIDDDLIPKIGAPAAIALGHLLNELRIGRKELRTPKGMEDKQFKTCLSILEKKRLIIRSGDFIWMSKSYLEILKPKLSNLGIRSTRTKFPNSHIGSRCVRLGSFIPITLSITITKSPLTTAFFDGV